MFPIPTAPIYVPARPLALDDAATFGSGFFTAPNPPFGAVFTYHLKDGLKTRRAARMEAEADAAKKNEDVFYPTWAELRDEDREEEPQIVLTVADQEGQVIRRLTGPTEKGIHRVAWDLRYAPANPASLQPFVPDNPYVSVPIGPMVPPGTYTVTLSKRVGGRVVQLVEPRTFTAQPLWPNAVPGDRRALAQFERDTARLQRAILGATSLASEANNRLNLLKKALDDAPGAPPALREQAIALQNRVRDLQMQLTGDTTVARRNEPAPPALSDRVQGIVYGHWTSTQAATATHRRQYAVAAEEFARVLQQLQPLVEVELKKLEDAAEAAGAPWTPGRVPRWSPR
jgi:hypothetical protein